MYCKIVDNTIVGTTLTLPKSYANISGFDTLDADALAGYGFFPLIEVKPELAYNEIDDGDKDTEGNTVYRKVFTQAYGQPVDTVGATVTRTYPVIDIPAAEVRNETNRPYLKSIALIEAKQARAVREAALGSPAFLTQIEAQIEALRVKLV